MRKNIEDIINKVLTGNSTNEEKEILAKWGSEAKENLEAMKSILDIENTISAANSLQDVNTAEAYYKVKSQVSTRPNKSKVYIGIAVLLLAIVFGLYYFVLNKKTDFESKEVNYAATETLLNKTLKDGSVFNLGLNGSLTELSARKIRLNGLGDFNVTRDVENAFEIALENGKITVLGTEFTVFTKGKEEEVYVKEGKVRYEYKETSVILEAGDYAKLLDGDVVVVKKVPENISNWKNIKLSYSNTPLNIVISDLEKKFNVDINTNKVSEKLKTFTITSNFTGEPLEKILTQLENLFGMKYQIINNEIVILDII
jgi:ferric-dicitrate binding protein FerR (iron transport regulator)